MLSSFSTGAPEPDATQYQPLPLFLEYVWLGDTAKIRMVVKDDYSRGVFLNEIHERTGMNALHIAVGRNNLEIARILVEAGIEFIADNEGRMPSLIAAICDVDGGIGRFYYRRRGQGPYRAEDRRRVNALSSRTRTGFEYHSEQSAVSNFPANINTTARS
jgi:hypothetical protein